MLLRRILVPVDFSERSCGALQYGLALARATGAEIDLLHVVPAPGQIASAVDAYLGRELPHASEGTLSQARDQLDSLVSSVDHIGVTVHSHVSAGDPAAVICALATEQPDDLIVIGTHGRRGFTELVLGSVAKTLIGCAPCPVVTLRGTETAHV